MIQTTEARKSVERGNDSGPLSDGLTAIAVRVWVDYLDGSAIRQAKCSLVSGIAICVSLLIARPLATRCAKLNDLPRIAR
jgi:hypothetical protein